jgi:hypothetical protein
MNQRLEHRLDTYRTAAAAQPAKVRQRIDWTHYATAAGSALALASGAEAAIVYSGTLNTDVPFVNNNQFTLDLDGNGTDLTLDFQVAGGFLGVQATASSLAVDGFGTFGTQAQLFAASQTLSTGLNLQSQGWVFVQSSSFGSVDGPWALGEPGFLGLFTASDNPAWIRLSFADTTGGDGLVDQMTLVDWAYDDSASTIKIGAGIPTPVPIPSPLALLALGAAGIAAARRVRKTRT